MSRERLPGPGDFEAEVVLLPHGVIRVWARRVASGLSLWLVYDFDAETVTALALTDRKPIPLEM